ncbi:MAG: UDP-N-acetylglucosamine 1-carboxyvinyltransferase [Flavobacteriales bacterium]
MGTFRVEGGRVLSGAVTPQGAKNEALQVLCAVLLTDEPVHITNIPSVVDVNLLIQILENLGVTIQKNGRGDYTFQADSINLDYLKSKSFVTLGASIRGSVMIIGPMLARFGLACIPRPGGDKIGRRRLDTHLKGLVALGGAFHYDNRSGFYRIACQELRGSHILLDEASVTGTANVLMAAALAEGKTTIYNAACEPYIQQLSKMLLAMGAEISGIGSNRLCVQGVKKLSGCTHRILPDMIEIGSWIGLAAMTGSKLVIRDVSWENLGQIPSVFGKLGIQVERAGADMRIPAQPHYEIQSFIDNSIMTISDAPWPGFTPDLLSVLLVVATQAKGSVLIHEKMFESRLFFVDKLIDMGAQVVLCDPHRASVIGLNHKPELSPTTLTSPDIRAGISLLIAALSATGTSTIHNIEQIDRGYEGIDDKLRKVGAHIVRLD